jgi:hypothetical protein
VIPTCSRHSLLRDKVSLHFGIDGVSARVCSHRSLRANIDETESAAIITEQGGQENHRERSQDGNSYCNQFA